MQQPPAALTMQMLDTNSPEDMTLREKFRAVVYLFFPETHPDTQPANVVKVRSQLTNSSKCSSAMIRS